jgi:shikimate dehydrogenase
MDSFIKGTTKIVCLFGNPVAHSISPQIQNHAFRSMHLPYVYIPLDVPRGKVHVAVDMLRSFAMAGANVTIPHKAQIVIYCDVLSPLSQRIGAANTLYFLNGLLHGTTTDPEGFLRALHTMGHDPKGGNIIILGNGGTARTLAYALALERIPAALTLVGRNAGKVKTLAEEISSGSGFRVSAYGSGDDACAGLFSQCSLCVNCTSAGMHPDTGTTPIDKKLFHRGMTVFDTVYNPPITRFLREAADAGCTVQNGLRMLLFQALASFKLWTGVEAREELFDIRELQGLVEEDGKKLKVKSEK